MGGTAAISILSVNNHTGHSVMFKHICFLTSFLPKMSFRFRHKSLKALDTTPHSGANRRSGIMLVSQLEGMFPTWDRVRGQGGERAQGPEQGWGGVWDVSAEHLYLLG